MQHSIVCYVLCVCVCAICVCEESPVITLRPGKRGREKGSEEEEEGESARTLGESEEMCVCCVCPYICV